MIDVASTFLRSRRPLWPCAPGMGSLVIMAVIGSAGGGCGWGWQQVIEMDQF